MDEYKLDLFKDNPSGDVKQDLGRNTCVAAALTMLANFVFKVYKNVNFKDCLFDHYAVSNCLVQYSKEILEDILKDIEYKDNIVGQNDHWTLKKYFRKEYEGALRKALKSENVKDTIKGILEAQDEKASLLAVLEAFFQKQKFGFVKNCTHHNKNSLPCSNYQCDECKNSIYKFDFCNKAYVLDSINQDTIGRIIGTLNSGTPLLMMINKEWIDVNNNNYSNPDHVVLVTGYKISSENNSFEGGELIWYEGNCQGPNTIKISNLVKHASNLNNTQPILLIPEINNDFLDGYYDVFISYKYCYSFRHADFVHRQIKEFLVKEIKDNQARVFFDINDNRGGANSIDTTCFYRVRVCKIFFLIISNDGIPDDSRDIYRQEVKNAIKAEKKIIILYHGENRNWETINKTLLNLGYHPDGGEKITYRTIDNWFGHFKYLWYKIHYMEIPKYLEKLCDLNNYNSIINNLLRTSITNMHNFSDRCIRFDKLEDIDSNSFPKVIGWIAKVSKKINELNINENGNTRDLPEAWRHHGETGSRENREYNDLPDTWEGRFILLLAVFLRFLHGDQIQNYMDFNVYKKYFDVARTKNGKRGIPEPLKRDIIGCYIIFVSDEYLPTEVECLCKNVINGYNLSILYKDGMGDSNLCSKITNNLALAYIQNVLDL